jgi:deoxyribose-phosphate aldolase
MGVKAAGGVRDLDWSGDGCDRRARGGTSAGVKIVQQARAEPRPGSTSSY